MIEQLLNKKDLSREDIIYVLNSTEEESGYLFKYSARKKEQHVGNNVYLRGLVEFSNICAKNCFYCGIRQANKKVKRYNITDKEILTAACYAYENNYGSLVLQSGELQSESFTTRIENLLKEIKRLSNNQLGITLSCGEQTEEVYKKWFEAGAHRYLLRIEASNPELYQKLHPLDDLHRFEKRLESLYLLKKCGYQTGTGVMIGLPFQSVEHLADDLLFMKNLDIDMCGMGPYIEHADTPLYQYRDQLLPLSERFVLTMKMVALLRILMPDINIASTTALQAIDKSGRTKMIQVGANVLMPNITPGQYKNDYALYENKPGIDKDIEDFKDYLEVQMKSAGNQIKYGEWGDSMHYKLKRKQPK